MKGCQSLRFNRQVSISVIIWLNHEVDFVLVKLHGDRGFFRSFFIELCLNLLPPYQKGVGRNTLHQEDIGSDRASSTNHRVSAKNNAVRIDNGIILHLGMALEPLDDLPMFILLKTARSESHSVIKFHPIANHAGLTDDHSGAMIDEEM